jgi:hypothetical protein
MDNQDINKADYQEQGPRKGIVIIVITILLGTNALLLWQFFDKKNHLDAANQTIVTTTAERDALQVQLNQFKSDFEKVKSENSDLQNQMTEKDEQIKAKVAEIQKLILLGGPAQIARAKAELAKLKEMNDVYVLQIDSLNTINAKLIAENETLNSSLTQERARSNSLTDENSRLANKVNAGSILKAMNVTTEGLRFKSNGKSIVTNKAKQVMQMRTHFVLAENHVIDNGTVDIYLRVLGPDGNIMASSSETIPGNSQNLIFTKRQAVEYNNSDTPVDVELAKGSQFAKGTYNVEIYHNGILIGRSKIDLK